MRCHISSGLPKIKTRKRKKEPGAKKATDMSVEDQIVAAVIEGRREDIEQLCNQALEKGIAPSELLEKKMIPAIMTVGEYYDERKYFLPQLIASAETMQNGFAVLEPALAASGASEKKGTLVFATVQGDIHDIGKNIVVLMLRNFGFDVVDLARMLRPRILLRRQPPTRLISSGCPP